MPAGRDLPHVPREERRRRTEQAILGAARELFAETGYERTTIREVARRAGVDPALVMQHFGSKEGLFAASAQWSSEGETVEQASRDDLPRAVLRDAFARFERDGAGREAAVALLRNCLTHPEAARVLRDEVVCDRAAAVGRTIGGPDGELRAGLLGACVLGLVLSRHLLEVEPVASASLEDVERLLEPALRVLVEGEPVEGGSR